MDPQLTGTASEVNTTFHQIRHGFNVGKYALLMPEQTRAEVVKSPSICRMPSTPEWFSGFVNHRGETIPVFDLSIYFQLDQDAEEKKEWVLLIDEHPQAAGILLSLPPQSLTDPVLVDPEKSEQAALPTSLKHAVDKVYQSRNQQWLELDHRRFFMSLKTEF